MKKTNNKDQIEIDKLTELERLQLECEYLEEINDIFERHSKNLRRFLKSTTPSAPTTGNVPLFLAAMLFGMDN